MEVNKPEAAAPVGRDPSRKKYRDILGEEHEDQQNGADDHRGDNDTVNIAGGFGAGITPEVQRLLDRLAGELEPLRTELDRMRAREKDLHDSMERHPYLPVLNRHGLEHEMARVVGHIQGLGAAAFICISIVSAEELRRQHGRKVYENAMTHACTVLASVLSPSDIIGCLGGHDLGVLALAPDDDVVERLAQDFRAALELQQFDCQGTLTVLDVTLGGVMLNRGNSFVAALHAADADLLAKDPSVFRQ
ncbi:MAG: GGDEF domain-containing protein [Rhodospirillales bacterium]|nr:GGDEF domain-containing protein [Rhodospirillales bacterium]